MEAPLLVFAAAPLSRAALTETATHLLASKYVIVSVFTLLVYDSLITFGDEVERVWKQPLSGATFLFALNRYGSLLQRPIIVASFLSPAWSHNLPACNHFVRFLGGSTLVIFATGELIMILRVWALWRKDKRILAFLIILWVCQQIITATALGFTKRVPFPPFLVGCILTGEDDRWIPFWVMPLVTDTAIFFLTVLRAIKFSRGTKHNNLIILLVRDGALYFFSVFSVNMLTMLLFIFATQDLKAIGAGFSQVTTTVAVSRLVLNLRGVRAGVDSSAQPASNGRSGSRKSLDPTQTMKMSRVDYFLGTLGQDTMEPVSPLPMGIVKETYTYQSRWPESADNLSPDTTRIGSSPTISRDKVYG